MLKTFRARGGILSLSRLPLRVHSEARQDAFAIQKVRFRRRIFRPKAILGGVLVSVLGYQLFTRVVLSPLDRIAEELEKTLTEEDKAKLSEADEPFFIPFPGTTRQVTPRPYRGSDPEWQEFVKFSKDPVLGKRVRDELAVYIRTICEGSPALVIRCGKGIKLRRYWLDVDFPISPPPEFERSGIEIADDYIAWTTAPVDALTVSRIRQALWPSAVAQSMWSWWTTLLFPPNYTKIAEQIHQLGKQINDKPSIDTLIANQNKKSPILLDTPKAPKSSPDVPAASKGPNSPTGEEEKLTEASRRAPTQAELDKRFEDARRRFQEMVKEAQALGIDTAKWDRERRSQSNPFLVAVNDRAQNAYRSLKWRFAQTWRPAQSFPPRGSIIVSGLIELDSPKAWVVIDVNAAWDPKTKSFDKRSMRLVLRRLQMKKQAPQGGR